MNNKKLFKKIMLNKIIIFLFIISMAIIIGSSAYADESPSGGGGGGGGFVGSYYNHIITLEQGWNIVSPPRIVESHKFSTDETAENFDIYLLDSENPAGWLTMQDLGQTEFTPLYGYFINNKTGSEQALTLNYRTDTEPNERLFMRELDQGWNVVGVANPSYALRQKEGNNNDINNINSILKSLSNNADIVLDFTADQAEKFSVKIGEQWDARVFHDSYQMNDLRETKAYAVYLNSAGTYQGFQNDDPVKIYDPVTISHHYTEWRNVPKNINDVALMDFTISTGYPIDVNVNNMILNISGDNLSNTDIKNLELICKGEVKWFNPSPIVGDNQITATTSFNVGSTDCKLIIDITDKPSGNERIQVTFKDLSDTSRWNIIGNDLRYSEYPNDISGYYINITNEYPLSIDRQWFGNNNKLTKNSVGNNIMGFNFYVNQPIDIEKMTVDLSGNSLQDIDIKNLELVCDNSRQWLISDPAVGENILTTSMHFDEGNYNCQLNIDITDNPNGNEKIKATLKNPNNQNYWIVKNSSNNIANNIYPSYDINGEEYRILIPSLSIETYNSGEIYLIGGQTNVDIVSFNFMAGEDSDVIVNSIKLNAYLSDTANTSSFTTNEKGASSRVEEVLTNISIYDNSYYGNPILLASEFLSVGQNDVSVTFDNLGWIISSWENKELLVKADITDSGPINGDDDTVAIAIESIDSVVAQDTNANNVIPTILNGNTNPDCYKTIKAFGTLSMYSQWQPSSLVVAGTNGILYTTIEFWANNEDFVIDRLRVVNDRYDYVGDDEFVNIILEDNNGTEIATANLINGIADFTGLNIYILKDEQTFVYVKANLNTIANGADSGDYTSLKIDHNDNFRAVGQDSGYSITSVGSYDPDGSNMYVYKSISVIIAPYSNSTLIEGNQTLFEFNVTVDSNGDISWKKIVFAVMKDSNIEITDLKLYSEEEEIAGTIIGSLLNQGDTSGTVIFVADGEQNVNAGNTKTYKLKAMISNVNTGSYVNTSINQSDEYYAEPTDYATVALTDASFAWSDKPAENHSENTADWNSDCWV